MKTRFGREILLLSLPVLIFGGVALLRSMNGRMALPSILTSNPFDPGPTRLEYSAFQNIEMQPLDVANGFDWGTQTTVSERGAWKMPPGWKKVTGTSIYATDLRLVYRRGKNWKQVPHLKRSEFSNRSDGSTIRLLVNLETVPGDAEEVRLRGHFVNTQWYRGPLPLGWNPLKNLKIAGLNRILTVQSKPFDLPIKTGDEPIPAPVVSHDPDIELVRAVWLHNLNGHQFLIVVRHISSSLDNTKVKDLKILSFSVKDGDGKPVSLFYRGDKFAVNTEEMYSDMGYSNIPNLPNDQSATELWSHLLSPRRGWENVKQPLQVEAKVMTASDAWPLTIRATMRQQEGDVDTLEPRDIR